MGDYRVGLLIVERPNVSLAAAVAASSAFPPVLSPSELDIEQPVVNTPGADLQPRCGWPGDAVPVRLLIAG